MGKLPDGRSAGSRACRYGQGFGRVSSAGVPPAVRRASSPSAIADLSDVDLSGEADLSQANFRGAQLTDANLTDAERASP